MSRLSIIKGRLISLSCIIATSRYVICSPPPPMLLLYSPPNAHIATMYTNYTHGPRNFVILKISRRVIYSSNICSYYPNNYPAVLRTTPFLCHISLHSFLANTPQQNKHIWIICTLAQCKRSLLPVGCTNLPGFVTQFIVYVQKPIYISVSSINELRHRRYE